MKICPRCGRLRMDDRDVMNSLSRHRPNIYVCNECGSVEAFLDCFGYGDKKWAIDNAADIKEEN